MTEECVDNFKQLQHVTDVQFEHKDNFEGVLQELKCKDVNSISHAWDRIQ
jgi:hypothetical protein